MTNTRLQTLITRATRAGLQSAKQRAADIISDILVNHLPRIEEGLRKGYVDENQILVIYDHAVRARVLTEHSKTESPDLKSALELAIDRLSSISSPYGTSSNPRQMAADAIGEVEELLRE